MNDIFKLLKNSKSQPSNTMTYKIFSQSDIDERHIIYSQIE